MNKRDWLTPGTIVFQNSIYKASVEDVAAAGGGLYTFATASANPKWPDQDIFYSGLDEEPGTTYNTIRSFTSHTDYTQYYTVPITDPGYTIVFPGDASVTVQSGNSVVTTYTLTKPAYPDDLTIVQTVSLHGTTFYSSTIEVTTAVTNTGNADVAVGIRYLWDFSLAGIDLSLFQQIKPDGLVLTEETDFSPVTFQYYMMTDDADAPNMYIYGTANGPATFSPPPTPPDRIVFASWPHARDRAFSYTITGSLQSDSCVLYYWGQNQGLSIPPGGTVSVTQYLFQPNNNAVRGIPFIK